MPARDPRTLSSVSADEIREILSRNEALKNRYLAKSTTANCPVCEREFLLAARHQKFCGDPCRAVWFKIKAQLVKQAAE
jgi:hypothetical protein